MNNIKPSVLTVAGSDSGGGAGIQADLRTFNAFKVYGSSVITAVTSQNPDEVRRVDVLPEAAVRSQFEAVMAAFPVRFAKSGMLANAEIIGCVAEMVKKYDIRLVADPVMVSTSGAKLLEDSAVLAMQKLLLPAVEWLTPNIPEAELLCRCRITSPDDLAAAAMELYQKYHCNCVLKSGHAITSEEVTDTVCYQGKLFALTSPAVEVYGNTSHGTGCTLSAALAANLAMGKSWQESLLAAKAFVYGSLCESVKLTDSLFQMYPPEKSYFSKVSLREL